MSNNLAIIPTQDNNIVAGFNNSISFDFMQRQAKMLASSALMPKDFCIVGIKDPADQAQKIANVMIALEMANRIGASPLMVCQNLYIVYGKPSWSSTFIIAAINGCGRFSAMRFEMSGEGDNRTCVAVATEKGTNERLESPPISVSIAKKEGWYGKNGSKWQTMPELMLRYRAATLFGRLYAPEILMGMKSVEELDDIESATVVPKPTAKLVMERFNSTGEIPITQEEIAELLTATPQENNHVLLQEIYSLIAILGKHWGETPDDTIAKLTHGKIQVQIELADKQEAWLKDMKLMIETAIAKEESHE